MALTSYPRAVSHDRLLLADMRPRYRSLGSTAQRSDDVRPQFAASMMLTGTRRVGWPRGCPPERWTTNGNTIGFTQLGLS
jgi:hypothetical protein